MKSIVIIAFFVLVGSASSAPRGEPSGNDPNTRQYASLKLGYYQPAAALNNGLIVGIDGITEFTHYRLTLGAAVDLYPKQSINIFPSPQPDGNPSPSIDHQQLYLLPLHVNAGYELFDLPDADTRCYAGIGGGYYFYFYNIEYHATSGGLLGGVLTSASDSKNGGNLFGTIFLRLVINAVFLEPRLYFASKTDDTVGGFAYTINPSGYSITLGFQYH